jgi:hypothetical protein
MRLVAMIVAAALVAAAPALTQPAPAFEPRVEQPEDFPAHPGREETFYACIACHAFQLVRRQQMSRERWDAIITEMVRDRGMAEPSEADRRLILDYLAAAFPVQAQPQGGWRNPFAQ